MVWRRKGGSGTLGDEMFGDRRRKTEVVEDVWENSGRMGRDDN